MSTKGRASTSACASFSLATRVSVGRPLSLRSSGGRPVQTFSKVCKSLQSLRLEDFLQTFFCKMQTFCSLFADFFCGFSTFMQTFCRLFLWIFHFHANLLQTLCKLYAANDSSSADLCFPFADFMHTYSRLDADLMQIKMVHCKNLADSMHTLRRANQCH